MNKIYISVVSALFCGMLMSSCGDLLDTENKSNPVSDDQYFSEHPEALLTTAYTTLQDLASQVDIYEQGTDLYLNTRGKNAGEFNEYTLTPQNSTVLSFYKSLYSTINFANGVMEYAGTTSNVGYQARFIRGYCYYLLSQQFGGVPYLTKYIKSSERNYPRVELSELYANVIADLEDVYNTSDLADSDAGHTGVASKQAVAALLAKFYLAKAWDLGTSLTNAEEGTYSVTSTADFTTAASWAEKAINGVALDMTPEQLWDPKNVGNKEEIFVVKYQRDGFPGNVEKGGHSLQNNFGGYYGACTTTGFKNVGSCNQQSAKSMYLFEKGDLRYEATYMTTMYNCTSADQWGTEGYYGYYNGDKSKLHVGLRFFPYYATDAEIRAEVSANKEAYAYDGYVNNVLIALLSNPVKVYSVSKDGTLGTAKSYSVTEYNNMTNNGVCVKKFDDPNSAQVTGSNDYRDIIVLRVADLYLVAAEANLLAGKTSEALAKINAVRQRAGLSALASFGAYSPQYTTSAKFKQSDIDLILDERARELYAENQRWMDLRRTKQLVRYNVEFNDYVGNADAMKGQDGNFKWYRPIPQGSIDKNEGISAEDQNPGY